MSHKTHVPQKCGGCAYVVHVLCIRSSMHCCACVVAVVLTSCISCASYMVHVLCMCLCIVSTYALLCIRCASEGVCIVVHVLCVVVHTLCIHSVHMLCIIIPCARVVHVFVHHNHICIGVHMLCCASEGVCTVVHVLWLLSVAVHKMCMWCAS